MTPYFQQFYSKVKGYGENIPNDLKEDFLKGSRPLMKYTNILTFNTRAIALYISMLLGQPWLYFIFEIVVMSAIFIYMHYRHEKLSISLYYKYFKGEK